MKKKKGLLLILIIIALCIAAVCWGAATHVLIGGQLFPVSADAISLTCDTLTDLKGFERMTQLKLLDVRQVRLSAPQYDQLAAILPDCRILWKVPAFGGYHDNTATELATASLQQSDIAMLGYLPDLQKVDATACSNLGMIAELRSLRPDLEVRYHAVFGQADLADDTVELVFSEADASGLLEAILHFPLLQKIDATGCGDYKALDSIRKAYPDLTITYTVPVGDQAWSYDAESLTAHNIDAEALKQVLPYFTSLKTVKLTGTVPPQETMYGMMQSFPGITFDWEFTVCGVTTSSTATELILNDIPMESTAEVEASLKYFYDLQRVEMCKCGISNEDMDALNNRYPNTRFIWALQIDKGYLRTDATAFIAFTYGYHWERPCGNEVTDLLKYCPDIICLDLGHMRMTDISFLKNMPNLKYLVLADTLLWDYTPIAELKELIYLEIFNTPFWDAEILLNLTKLEDLNISWAQLRNPELLAEMTWLKRLWATQCGFGYMKDRMLIPALPDTQVFLEGEHPTDGGWRQSPHYYEMRDLLGMSYME